MGLFVRVEGSFLEFEGGDVSMFQEGLGLKRETLGKPDVCLFFALTLLSPSIIYYIQSLPTPTPHIHIPLSVFSLLYSFTFSG